MKTINQWVLWLKLDGKWYVEETFFDYFAALASARFYKGHGYNISEVKVVKVRLEVPE